MRNQAFIQEGKGVDGLLKSYFMTLGKKINK